MEMVIVETADLLDTLSVSNSSNRNGNSRFVALIASLNIMVRTFAKIAKMLFTKRRLVLILHLEAKNAKMDCKNEIYAKKKLGKKHPDNKKINPGKSQRPTLKKSTVNPKKSTLCKVNSE